MSGPRGVDIRDPKFAAVVGEASFRPEAEVARAIAIAIPTPASEISPTTIGPMTSR